VERRRINYRENTAYRDQVNGQKFRSDKVVIEDLRTSSTGWMGRYFPALPATSIIRDWNDGALFEKLKDFFKVWYEE